MNNHLQTVLNSIQQSKDLSSDDKNIISKALQDADDELNHKTRDLEIETALERVRTVALGMKKPDDLLSICKILYSELIFLGFAELRNAMINIHDDDAGSFLNYDYSDAAGGTVTTIFYNSHPATENLVKQIKKANDAFGEFVINGNELEVWRAYRKGMGEQDDPKLDAISSLSYYFYSIGIGAIGISTYYPITMEKQDVLKRFRNVFDFAYRRYMDVTEAKTQAREAQIELALEKIRARTMAMRRSDELLDTVLVLFQQFKDLGESPVQITIGIINEEERVIELWLTIHGDKTYRMYKATIDEPIVINKVYVGWKEKMKSLVIDLNKQQLHDYNNFRRGMVDGLAIDEHGENRRVINVAYFSKGLITISASDPMPAESLHILERFANVFDLTYTRFLDLKQAEEQAKEAQIEVALERVRSRTLAMQKSDELAETSEVVFKQLNNFGIAPTRLYIGIIKEDSGDIELWGTDEEGDKLSSLFNVNIHKSSAFFKIFEGWKEKKDSIIIDMQGKELNDYFQYLSTEVNVKFKEGLSQERRVQTVAFFSHGFIAVVSQEPQTVETNMLLERFASVFNLTYTRFSDLKIAEAQAVNAKIEEQKLREEKRRSDSLLLNILPEDIANELKQFGKSYARSHEQVSVLFCDIKGFSSIAGHLSAEELVNQLDECFRAFDKITEKHGLEKIKTIGDAYMCACGLPKPVPDNAIKTVSAALDMLDFLKGFNSSKKIQDLPAFEFRFGIHTGPAVTGVVGLKKFTYDIWGDTVNLAARMEQNSEAGRINVSGATYQLIKDKFNCTPRGKIEAKNIGEVDMYFVESAL